MIAVEQLSKRYGSTVAVDGLTFSLQPGVVTGFLGANGAGKSTTMRMILGLDAPSGGRATIKGVRYAELGWPLREVGAVIDPKAFNQRASGRANLRILAATNRLPRSRVDTVLDLVGLDGDADRRAGGYSLGMSQRLAIAAALLGDPEVVVLDEPVNGLDPDGVVWIRQLMQSLAAEGRTVFVSSHLMSEMALTATNVVIIDKGRLVADSPLQEFVASQARSVAVVRSRRVAELAQALTAAGGVVEQPDPTTARVTGMDTERIGVIAADLGVALIELTTETTSLEEAFLHLTHEADDGRPTAAAAGSAVGR